MKKMMISSQITIFSEKVYDIDPSLSEEENREIVEAKFKEDLEEGYGWVDFDSVEIEYIWGDIYEIF